ncbi:MAG: exodeoxyribonuclease VII small subunit [Salinivirgaceae bacterium]|nr:exodeoxyribonuclease VII small subunit [Salinivirgaceae bacterium]MDD4746069.1 exodeoxyribonuclease VII small subunit [Salinivirgaceae bacterium]MDY0281349.1 exodeoxyribonuclease VII small subunit [Salinivirgaceae bacterium]
MAKKKLTYSEKIEEIESIIEYIESDQTDVDILRAKISLAAELLAQCKGELKSTEQEIQTLLDDDSE